MNRMRILCTAMAIKTVMEIIDLAFQVMIASYMKSGSLPCCREHLFAIQLSNDEQKLMFFASV